MLTIFESLTRHVAEQALQLLPPMSSIQAVDVTVSRRLSFDAHINVYTGGDGKRRGAIELTHGLIGQCVDLAAFICTVPGFTAPRADGWYVKSIHKNPEEFHAGLHMLDLAASDLASAVRVIDDGQWHELGDKQYLVAQRWVADKSEIARTSSTPPSFSRRAWLRSCSPTSSPTISTRC